jgi:hypothetical protein
VGIGRYCELNNIQEVKDLSYGMDFRKPEYRREVFLRFYEFSLKYNAHAGAVYYVFKYLFNRLNMTTEQKLWFTFINGCSQNAVTTYLIYQQFPDLHSLDIKELRIWFRRHYAKLGWDTDRRYHKNVFEDCVKHYKEVLCGRTQEQMFRRVACSDDKFENFRNVWNYVSDNFYTFGRLSTFSYLEYLRIAGINLDCDSLFLDNISGSKSHRNGLCKVLGRDDLDWNKNDVKYDKQTIAWLTKEAEILLKEAEARINHEDVSYFTLETTLCCYKGWHRKNRRYPNVYNDMFRDRIEYAERQWNKKFPIFWECRKECLPEYLRIEDNPNDCGLKAPKQNHYRNYGEVVMMDKEWDCFKNRFNA